MSRVYIFLADGFEEVEGLTVVDLLRRAGAETVTVSISSTREVAGAHGISVMADRVFSEVDFSGADMLVLPGGMPGTLNLKAYEPLVELLKDFYGKDGKVAAICAAPSIFSELGFLKGRKATAYPSFLEKLDCAQATEDCVVVDGNVTTSRGVGTAIDFALCLISQLAGEVKAAEIAESIVWKE